MNTVGVITGKFAPLHKGHIHAIMEASTQVDRDLNASKNILKEGLKDKL